MRESETENPTDEDQPVNRRHFLIAAGSLGMAPLVAGCSGQGGPGVETTQPPTEGTMVTDSPVPEGTSSPRETPSEAPSKTDTQTQTEGSSPTPTSGQEPTSTDTPTEPDREARVRVAHLSPNAPNVDVFVDGNVILEDFPYGDVSQYMPLSSGAHGVEITVAGDRESSVFEGEIVLDPEEDYTVAAIGEVGDDVDQEFRPIVLTDENEPPNTDTARLRAVHVSPDAPAVDITAGDTVLFDGLAFGESAYAEVSAGDYTIDIRPDSASNDGDVVDSFDVTLDGGWVYSAFASGYLNPDAQPSDVPFDLIITQDNDGG